MAVKVWAIMQAVVPKSSAESDLYGIVKGACVVRPLVCKIHHWVLLGNVLST